MVEYFLLGLVTKDGDSYVNAIAGPDESPMQWLLRYNRQRDSKMPQLVLLSSIKISQEDALDALEKELPPEAVETRDVKLFQSLRYGDTAYQINGDPISVRVFQRSDGKFVADCAELRLKIVGTRRDLVLDGIRKEFLNQHLQYSDDGFVDGVALPPISSALKKFHRERVTRMSPK